MDFATFLQELLRQGILGLIIIGFIVGWIVPKPSMDRLHKECELKDKIIERQAAVIERLAETAKR